VDFDWKMLKGKDILGFRQGSTPILFFEEALRMNGLDPQTDVKLNNNIATAARVGAWLSGSMPYGIFVEPDVSQLELDGKGYFIKSIGQTVGFADYTSFMATDQYMKANPEIIQAWTDVIYRAQKWTAEASVPDIVSAVEPFFPGISQKALASSAERYKTLKMWKTSPVVEPKAIEKFQDILVHGHVLDEAKRVKFGDLVVKTYAEKAK
jgi:NitT/TauT family transport system substrate-binding protein